MKKRHLAFAICALLGLIILYPGNACPESAVTLEALVDEALANNPKVRAAYNKYIAARYKAKDVSHLPDPMGKYTNVVDGVQTRVGPQEHKYGFSQKIPFPLKLYYKGKAELKHADMLKEEYEAAKRQLVKDVSFTYYDIFWLDMALDILDQEKTVLENLEKVARRKFETGISPQQDAIKAGVEISKILDRMFMVRQQRSSKAAMLNSILNRPRAAALGKTGAVETREFNYTLDQLHGFASKHRQELLGANLNVERAKYERSIKQLNFIPDLTFGFDYISVGSGTTTRGDDGADAWMATFAVNLPIWVDKMYAQIKEKEFSLLAAKENLDDVENKVSYETEDVYFKITTYKEIVSLYETALMPQTKQSFEAARTGYETGKVDFLDWLDAERVYLQTRLAYYKAITDYEKSIAYLERVAGVDL